MGLGVELEGDGQLLELPAQGYESTGWVCVVAGVDAELDLPDHVLLLAGRGGGS